MLAKFCLLKSILSATTTIWRAMHLSWMIMIMRLVVVIPCIRRYKRYSHRSQTNKDSLWISTRVYGSHTNLRNYFSTYLMKEFSFIYYVGIFYLMPTRNFCLCGHSREYHEQWYYLSSRHIDITGRCMYSVHNRSCPCNNFVPLNKGRISSILKEA